MTESVIAGGVDMIGFQGNVLVLRLPLFAHVVEERIGLTTVSSDAHTAATSFHPEV